MKDLGNFPRLAVNDRYCYLIIMSRRGIGTKQMIPDVVEVRYGYGKERALIIPLPVLLL